MKRRFHPPALRIVALALLVLAWLVTPAPALRAQQPTDSGAFLVLVGVDTFAVEHFSRSGDRLEGEISGQAVGRIAYSARLSSAGSVDSLSLQAWGAGATAEQAPAQSATFALRGDSVLARLRAGGTVSEPSFASRAGAVIYVNPSMALMEQVARRGLAVGGDSAEVPMFITAGAQTLVARVTRPHPDSVVVSLPGSAARFHVDRDGRVLGGSIPAQNIRIQRIATSAAPVIRAPEAPDYSAPPGAPYTAEEVRVPTPDGHTLAGTLTRPTGPGRTPAVVTITGSGAQERDQSVLPGYRPFREVADTLARRGIATLRLDDRGTGASTGDFAGATSLDFAEDVRAALEYLRSRDDIDPRRLALVGHSEGGLIAPLVATADSLLAAVVLVAGPARTGREIIEFQQRSAIERNPDVPLEARDSVRAAARDALRDLAGVQPWMRYFLDHDPLPVAARLRLPVLILHGATDAQVTPDQAEMLAAAIRAGGNPRVEAHLFPGVNHLLLRDPDGSPEGYTGLTDRSVAPEVLGRLADWLAERLR